jgi:hypothetical protein
VGESRRTIFIIPLKGLLNAFFTCQLRSQRPIASLMFQIVDVDRRCDLIKRIGTESITASPRGIVSSDDASFALNKRDRFRSCARKNLFFRPQ